MDKIPPHMKKYDFAPITSDDRVQHIPLGGKPIECLMVDDVVMMLHTIHMLPDIRKHVPNIKNMEMDEDDVIICAFAKAGTHWIWEIVSMLRRGKAEYHDQTKESAMMEFVPPEKLREHPRPRVYNTHFTYSHIPQQAKEKKCKIIFIERNPKDILVSFLPFLKTLSILDQTVEWNEFIERYMELDVDTTLLNWFYYTKSWHHILKENQENIHCMAFEDLKEDPVREISRLAKFLEVEENMTLFDKIADKCSFSNLKKASESKRHIMDDGKGTQFVYRKGQVGNWKNYFTVSQNERFDALCNEKMKDVDVKYRYTL